MQHLFSTAGMAHLASLLCLRPLLALDFDGTLAPIVSRPADASISKAAAEKLARLSLLVPVAIVTGRCVGDVRKRLGFEPAYVIGGHGAEGLDYALPTNALHDAYAWLEEHRATLERLDVEVEDKRYCIALHYRRAKNPADAALMITTLLASLKPTLRTFGGKMVFNIVPAGAPDKADAVREIVRRESTAGAIFVGDDVNDEPVFIAAPPHWLTVKVGHVHAPPEPSSAAKFHVRDCAEVVLMLERMVAMLEGATGAA